MSLGPNTWVRERRQLWKKLHQWQSFLMQQNGRPVAAAIASKVPFLTGGAPTVFWTSDACTKDSCTAQEGIGGVDGSTYWQYLPPPELAGILHITSLEAMGRLGNTVHFGPNHPTGSRILCEADAISTVALAQNETSKAPDMVQIHDMHEALADYQRLKITTIERHIHGILNCLADWVSRDKIQLFERACKQMGITPRRVPTDPKFVQLFEQLVDQHLQRAHE
jgi:hypothetical protein